MILALAIALASPAVAQEQALEGICDPFSPVAGTAGFSNGLQAIRTNAQTYGAGQFARNRLRGYTYMAMDFRGLLGAAMVPSLCTDQVANRTGDVYAQPLDLGATNLGLNLPLVEDATDLHMGLRVFYASSVTTSTMGNRLFTTSLPLMNLYPALLAPLIGRNTAGGSLTTFSVDWIGGASFKSDVVSVQAGYTGTRGLFLDVTQDKIALFVNTALTQGFSLAEATYLLGGVQQFDPLNIGSSAEAFGMSSLFYRELPQTEVADEQEPGLIEQLRTGHLRQEDMGGWVDVRATWQFGSQARVRELAVAGHSQNWFGRVDDDQEEGAWYVRGGFVNLPDQPLFGVQGGVRPTLRAVYKSMNNEGWGIEVAAHMNDPDLLDLYPFAYNAFGSSAELSLDGSNW